MRKTAVVFFSLLLVLASGFIAGCSSLPFGSETPAPVMTPAKGISSGQGAPDAVALESSALSQRYAFEDILENLKNLDLTVRQPGNSFPTPEPARGEMSGDTVSDSVPGSAVPAVTGTKQIKQLRGGNLDENGAAASWTLIVEQNGRVSIVSFSHQGTTFTGSPGSVNLPEIKPDQIVSPAKLFEKNHGLIFSASKTGTTVTRDISLVASNYTVTISDKRGPSEILTFDAKTGALIP
jgi:hypothetical protein